MLRQTKTKLFQSKSQESCYMVVDITHFDWKLEIIESIT